MNKIKKILNKIKNKIINLYYKDPLLFYLWLIVIILFVIVGIAWGGIIASAPFLFIGETEEDEGTSYKVSSNGSFSSGGGNSKSGKSQSERERSMADKLEDVANRNHDLLDAKLNNGMDIYNTSDEQSRTQWKESTQDNIQKAANDWFTQTKKLQGSADQLKSQAGGSFNGSNFYAFLDLLARADDDIDTETLNTKKENQDIINKDLFEALSSSVNARNELAADSQYAHGQIGTDFLAQVANIAGGGDNPGLYDEKTSSGAVTRGNNIYNERKTGPAQYINQDFYREPNAGEEARKMYEPTTINSSSTNNNYWAKMLNGYNKR